MNAADSHSLKNLQTRRTQIEVELKEKTVQFNQIKADISTLNGRLGEIERDIARIKSSNGNLPVVTEHALLRYLERIRGIDMNEIVNEILTEKNVEIIGSLNTCQIPIKDNMYLVVKGKTVVSVAEKTRKKNK